MLDFFDAYDGQTKLQPLVAEISRENLGAGAEDGTIMTYATQCVANWIFLFKQFSPQRGENCSNRLTVQPNKLSKAQHDGYYYL